MLPTFDQCVTGALLYLFIGSLVWCAIYCAGLVDQAAGRNGATVPAIVVASIYVILIWPVVVFTFMRGALAGARRQ